MRKTWVLSPSLPLARAVKYARACIADSLARKEAPISPVLLYNMSAGDKGDKMIPGAIELWRDCACGFVLYTDLGVDRSMQAEIERLAARGGPALVRAMVERRTLAPDVFRSLGLTA